MQINRICLQLPKVSTRNFSCQSTALRNSEKGWLSNIFVRRLESVKESQSDRLSDSQSVYEMQFHRVKPDCMKDYLENYKSVTDLIEDRKLGGSLVGSWTIEIGTQDTAIHLWQHRGGYKALNKHYDMYRTDSAFDNFREKRNQMLKSRKTQICLPFSFWPDIKSRNDLATEKKHIYELRSYTLKPGTMIEWGNYWARGIRNRQQDHEAVAGLFSHIGEMHVVHHLWVYKNLEHRKQCRDSAWMIPGWDDCVLHTVPLIRHMTSSIMMATPHSPLQ